MIRRVAGCALYWCSLLALTVSCHGDVDVRLGSDVADTEDVGPKPGDAGDTAPVSSAGGAAPIAEAGVSADPEVWAQGPPGIYEMELDATHVYWVVDGVYGGRGVWRADRVTATAERLALITEPLDGRTYALALDETHVYFTDTPNPFYDPGAAIRRVSKWGGEVEVITSGNGGWNPTSIAVDETHVYFNAFNDARSPGGEVRRQLKSGGEPETFWVGLDNAWDLAVDDTHLYVSEMNQGRIVRKPKLGGAVEVLASGWVATSTMRLRGDSLYFSACTIGACQTQRVYGVSRSGGVVDLLYEGPDGWGLAATADAVLWGRWRIPFDGGAPEELLPASPNGFVVAADERGAYLGDHPSGAIFFVSRVNPL
jgi:hypothetical protein